MLSSVTGFSALLDGKLSLLWELPGAGFSLQEENTTPSKRAIATKPNCLSRSAKLIRHRTGNSRVLRGKFSANIFAYLLNNTHARCTS